jgi:anti-sigma B factor antagonist
MPEDGGRIDRDLLRVDLSATDSTVVVSVAGEVDMLTAHDLWVTVDRAISEADGRPVTIDLNGVLFFGSRGVAALERAAASARRGNVALRVAIAPGRPARRILELTGLERILTLSDTVGDAP